MDSPGPDGGAAFDRDAAERVVRRAIELVDDRSDSGGAISDRALFEAADELGIDPAEMQRAMAEERVGLLSGVAHHRGDRMVGPERIGATRLVDGDVEAVLDLTDRWLRRTLSFKRVRRDERWADYRRRSDVAATLQRTARSVTGAQELAHVRRVSALAADAGGGRTLLVLAVDVSTSRTSAAAGGIAVGATGVATAGASALAWMPWAWVGVPVAAAAGVGVMAARKAYVGGIEEELESVLDSVATGLPPASVVSGLAERLVGGRTDRFGQVRSRP